MGTLTVTAKEIEKCLIQLETELHAKGWDNTPAQLWLLDKQARGIVPIEAVDSSTLTRVTSNPAEGLMMGVHGITHLPGPQRLLPTLWSGAAPNFAGAAFTTEVWARSGSTAELLEEAQADPRHFADIPGSNEGRIANAVDIHGNEHIVFRKRGGAVVTRVRPHTPFVKFKGVTVYSGRIPQALAELVLAIRKA